jgi:hypothetical protein
MCISFSQNFIIGSQPESLESGARPRILLSQMSFNVIFHLPFL